MRSANASASWRCCGGRDIRSRSYLHGALVGLTELYESLGVPLEPALPALGVARDVLKGRIVLAPPAATADLWSRRLPDPLVAMASGWMRVRQRAKARESSCRW